MHSANAVVISYITRGPDFALKNPQIRSSDGGHERCEICAESLPSPTMLDSGGDAVPLLCSKYSSVPLLIRLNAFKNLIMTRDAMFFLELHSPPRYFSNSNTTPPTTLQNRVDKTGNACASRDSGRSGTTSGRRKRIERAF